MSTGIVTAYALYLREGPDRSHPVLGALYKDDLVTILADSPDKLWKKLRTADGTEGWSSAKYLAHPQHRAIPRHCLCALYP